VDLRKVVDDLLLSNSKDELLAALQLGLTMVTNIIKSPAEWKTYRLKNDNQRFASVMHRLSDPRRFLSSLGFLFYQASVNEAGLYIFRGYGGSVSGKF
jgi:hypothetical protein